MEPIDRRGYLQSKALAEARETVQFSAGGERSFIESDKTCR